MRRPYRGALLLFLAFLAACGGPGTPRPPGPGTINFDAADRTPESCGGGAGLGALRLKAVLQRMGFKVGLTRTGTYGGRGRSVSATMSGNDHSYVGSGYELALRGWDCMKAMPNCPWPSLYRESRASQVLDSLNFPLDASGVADARVT